MNQELKNRVLNLLIEARVNALLSEGKVIGHIPGASEPNDSIFSFMTGPSPAGHLSIRPKPNPKPNPKPKPKPKPKGGKSPTADTNLDKPPE